MSDESNFCEPRPGEESGFVWKPVEGEPVRTDFGWALAGAVPPGRDDLLWLKLPERHVYCRYEDGWHRIQPPERQAEWTGDLPHG